MNYYFTFLSMKLVIPSIVFLFLPLNVLIGDKRQKRNHLKD